MERFSARCATVIISSSGASASLGIWIGLGAAMCWRSLAASVRGPRALAFATPVLAIALLPLVLNAHAASRGRPDIHARGLRSTCSTPWRRMASSSRTATTTPFRSTRYAQIVEGHRRDVAVIVASYLGTDWFPRQLMRRGVALAPTIQDADSVPDVIRLDAPQQFDAEGIHATIPAGYLTRDQLFVLRIVHDVLPTRPVYFSNASYPNTLGLAPYLVTEGLAVHLMPSAVTESASIARTNGGMVDVARSLELWRKSFTGPASFERQGEWIDAASIGMPAQYVFAGSMLAAGLESQKSVADAAAVQADVQKILGTANLGALFGR